MAEHEYSLTLLPEVFKLAVDPMLKALWSDLDLDFSELSRKIRKTFLAQQAEGKQANADFAVHNQVMMESNHRGSTPKMRGNLQTLTGEDTTMH